MNIQRISTVPLTDYWEGLRDKLDILGDVAKSFATLVQNYIWIPIIISLICLGLMIGFGGREEASTAKKRTAKIALGVFIVMAASILTSILIGFFAPSDVKSIGL